VKIISLVGSPHGEKGNTAKLLNLVLEGAKEKGATVETIIAKPDNIIFRIIDDARYIQVLKSRY
jgi:multimeric flavodoxin WrbA